MSRRASPGQLLRRGRPGPAVSLHGRRGAEMGAEPRHVLRQLRPTIPVEKFEKWPVHGGPGRFAGRRRAGGPAAILNLEIHWYRVGVGLGFELKSPDHEIHQVLPTVKDHITR